MSALFSLHWWEVFLGGVSTLAIYSFLYRENAVYRFFEHLFIGIATGISIIMVFRTFLWQEIFKPLLGMDRVIFPDGTYSEPYNKLYLLYLAPMALGLLYYFILTKRYSWLAQIAIGFGLGVSGGLAFKGFINEMYPQLTNSFRPLYIKDNVGGSISNIVFIFTLTTALSYFFFTFKQRKGRIAERSAKAGRWMMMGCFGAFFGSTIMARMALLVERLDFLINTWGCNMPWLKVCG